MRFFCERPKPAAATVVGAARQPAQKTCGKQIARSRRIDTRSTGNAGTASMPSGPITRQPFSLIRQRQCDFATVAVRNLGRFEKSFLGMFRVPQIAFEISDGACRDHLLIDILRMQVLRRATTRSRPLLKPRVYPCRLAQ
jgi:hypothetical protein